MTHSFRPATRDHVSLIIGAAGATGTGKTYSLLLLATGLAYPEATDAAQLQAIIAQEGRNRICFIDTERGRALHYAPPPGDKPDPWRASGGWFAFDQADLEPPYSPARYQEMIEAADGSGYRVVIVDSFSHEWSGEGGILEMQEVEFQRMGSKEGAKMASWIKPKMAHKKLVGRLTALRSHLLVGLRADSKVKMLTETQPNGFKKTVVIAATDLPPAERWVPVCDKSFPFELTLSFVLAPDAPGVPIPVKLQEQHRSFVAVDRPLSMETGRALASWADGGHVAATPELQKKRTPREFVDAYLDDLATAGDLESLASLQATRQKALQALQAREPELYEEVLAGNAARFAELSQEPVQ